MAHVMLISDPIGNKQITPEQVLELSEKMRAITDQAEDVNVFIELHLENLPHSMPMSIRGIHLPHDVRADFLCCTIYEEASKFFRSTFPDECPFKETPELARN